MPQNIEQYFSPERVEKSKVDLAAGDFTTLDKPKTIDEIAVELHRELGELLLERIKMDEASSTDIASAIKWLKDQGTVLNMSGEFGEKKPVNDITRGLPLHALPFKREA